jgi:hypothetical protein
VRQQQQQQQQQHAAVKVKHTNRVGRLQGFSGQQAGVGEKAVLSGASVLLNIWHTGLLVHSLQLITHFTAAGTALTN